MMRYKLIAYVCDHGGMRRKDHEGMSDLWSIFVNRPDRCRYAVVTDGREFIVIDLFDLRTPHGLRGPTLEVELGDHVYHSTEEGAIMATLLTYEKE